MTHEHNEKLRNDAATVVDRNGLRSSFEFLASELPIISSYCTDSENMANGNMALPATRRSIENLE
jgi:hypothetical protein